MKKLLVLSGFLMCNLTYADNVIYKCTSSTGEVTYQNNMGNKSECTKTNFASFPNINIFKSDNFKKTGTHSSNNSSNINSSGATTSSSDKNNNLSEEQKVRDSKRVLILTQELNQEKEQLNTVSTMLKNLKETNSKDTTQIAQLEELKTSHVNNITAIERELGNAKPVVKVPELKIEKATLEPNLNNSTMMVTKALTAPASLPTSLPPTITPSLSKIKPSVIQKPEVIQSNKIEQKKDISNVVIDNKKNTSVKNMVVIASVNSSKNTHEEIRKNNSLGKTTNYSSGLSGMSKIKK